MGFVDEGTDGRAVKCGCGTDSEPISVNVQRRTWVEAYWIDDVFAMTIKMTLNEGRVPIKIWTEDIEPAAIIPAAVGVDFGCGMNAIRKDDGVLDEIPGAYKDIDQVMDNQRDLVVIIHTLKQVVCVKG